MARVVLTDVSVTINSVDLSDHISQVEITRSFDDVETTAFGDAGRTRTGGLEDSSLTLTFHQDFDAASVNATISALVGTTTTFLITPTSGAVSATNPSYGGTVLVTEWTPIGGAVGDLSTVDVTWPVSGVVTESTGV